MTDTENKYVQGHVTKDTQITSQNIVPDYVVLTTKTKKSKLLNYLKQFYNEKNLPIKVVVNKKDPNIKERLSLTFFKENGEMLDWISYPYDALTRTK